MAIVVPKLQKAGSTVYFSKIAKRAVLIFCIGFVLNWLPFFLWRGDEIIFKSWTWLDIHSQQQGLRDFGVLQRIALAYGFAGIVLYFFQKRVMEAALIILFLSTCLAYWFGAPSDPWSLEGYYGTGVDRLLLGSEHLYHGEGVAFDPEGLMSTLGSVGQVLLGYWGGKLILEFTSRNKRSTAALQKILLWALASLLLGYAWSCVEPINKKIWTSSYTLVTTGYALTFLAVLDWRNWTSSFFEVFGKNPLFIYCASVFVPRFLGLIRISAGSNAEGSTRYITPFNWFYENVCAKIPGNTDTGSLVYAVCIVLLYWLIATFLDRRKIYVRV